MIGEECDLMLDMRASTFHPPSLDMLDQLGVAPALISQGLVTPKFQYRDRLDGLIAEFDLRRFEPAQAKAAGDIGAFTLIASLPASGVGKK